MRRQEPVIDRGTMAGAGFGAVGIALFDQPAVGIGFAFACCVIWALVMAVFFPVDGGA